MKRLDENPLISPADVKPSRPDYEVLGAFNPGVAKMGDGTILLLRVAERPAQREEGWLHSPIWNAEKGDLDVLRCRKNDPDVGWSEPRCFQYRGGIYLTSISHLRVARSTDGVSFEVEEQPALFPAAPTEAFGIEDCRITRIGDAFWITCKIVSRRGAAVALAETADFREFKRRGTIFCPHNLDVVIFPEKIGGDYVAWTRPESSLSGSPAIWLARSPDLLHWGRHEPVMLPRPGMWDAGRVGASAVPFMTERGWLEIYHGADEEDRYCAGAALLDRGDPAKVLARSAEPILRPEAKYEVEGFFGGVVFASGAAVTGNGEVTVYYGASDETTCAAVTTVEEILAGLPGT